MPTLIEQATAFATAAHGTQKTPHGLPYMVHVLGVADFTRQACDADLSLDRDLAIPVALLHDTVEDTKTTLDQIAAPFGPAIAAGVDALSKPEDLPKPEAMRHSLAAILRLSREIAVVKLADRIINLGPPPPHWTAAKRSAYKAEARTILDRLGHASPFLAAILAERIAAYPAA